MAQSVSLRKRSCSFDAIFIQVPLTHYLNKHGVERLESRCAFNIGWKANWRERKLQRWDVPAMGKKWTLVTWTQKSIKTMKDSTEQKQSLQNWGDLQSFRQNDLEFALNWNEKQSSAACTVGPEQEGSGFTCRQFACSPHARWLGL